MTRRLFIVDQSLRDLDGHHYEYDLAVGLAARAAGWEVSVAAHRAVRRDLPMRSIPVEGWFSQVWHDAQNDMATRTAAQIVRRLPEAVRGPVLSVGRTMKRALTTQNAAPPHSTFGEEFRALLVSRSVVAEDHVLVHTLSMPELHALIDVMREAPSGPYVHVVLRRDPDEPNVARDAAIAFERATALRKRLFFYADTDALAQAYAALGESVVREAPIPLLVERPPPRERAAGPLRFVYLGDARAEKGFQLLPAAVARLRQDANQQDVRFLLQANENIRGGDPEITRAKRVLSKEPAVELIDRALDAQAFEALLESADLVLLAYKAALYRRRSSGVLARALAAGKPAVVPAGTWMAAFAGRSAATFESEADFAAAVARALNDLPALRQQAEANADHVRQVCDAARFFPLFDQVERLAVPGTPAG